MSQIFISYSHQDSETAARIAQALADAGLEPWIDRNTLKLGESVVSGVNEAIGRASYVILLVSKSSLASRWVSMEWMAALAKDDTVVIPVTLEALEVPPLLKHVLGIDLSADQEGGIERLTAFFENELRSHRMRRRSASPPAGPLLGKSRRILRLVAMRCLEPADLLSFLWDHEISSSRLAGNSLQERILYLLHLLDADGIQEDFAEWLTSERARCVERAVKDLEVQ